ncbi:MAG: metallophosphoesterase [Muribaculaceae bacterium]|nr:metallophosphoesterase [Muribaculaceae bacterium]
MRLPVLLMSVVFLLSIAVDTYLYRIIASRCRKKCWSRTYLYSSIILIIFLVSVVCVPRRSETGDSLTVIMWSLFGYVTVYLPKVLCVFSDAVSCIPSLWGGRRWRAVSVSGAMLAVTVCVAMWWGALVNRFALNVENVEVNVPDLPPAFDGYRMVQISDLHVGTYGNDTAFVSAIVDRINAQNADAVLFTGDAVNRRTDELLPFVKPLSRLRANDGVYSILGNHDYGDYIDWGSEESKRENMELMYRLQYEMGWRLLRNEHEMLYRGNDSIALVGVENWGDPPFPTYGSLSKAYPSMSDSVVKVLLTHNPAHWVSEVKDDEKVNIALTLSGHTHAMQVSMCGLSPAAWRYPTWGGCYESKSGRCVLYVNIGIGTVGVPMRLGATPEITVITLKRSK